MKVTPASIKITLALIILFACAFVASAQKADSTKPPEKVNPILQKIVDQSDQQELPTTSNVGSLSLQNTSRFIKTADFYLKDGQFITGKVIVDDRNKITVEKLEGSTIVAVTYSRKQIEPRSIQTKNVPASKFYLDMAEHFAGMTWDFKNDPDDFIIAIRCYEKAKLLVNDSSELGAARVNEIEDKIKELHADKEVWAKEIENRAKLKELEFQAEYQTRFKELQDQIEAGSKKLDESISKIETAMTQSDTNNQKLTQDLATIDQEVRRQLAIMADQIEATRRMVDPFYRPPVYRYR